MPKLLDRYEQVITLMLAGHSVTGIAAIMSVSRKQVHVWQKDPKFVELYNQTKHDLLNSMKDVVVGSSVEAMRVIAGFATDIRLSPAERLPAAKHLSEVALKFSELMDNREVEDEFVPIKKAHND